MLHLKFWSLAVLFVVTASSCTSGIGQTPASKLPGTQTLVRTILFESSAAMGSYELFTVNSDGTDLKQLTNLKTGILEVSWSWNGQYIAFTSLPEGSDDLVLNVMNADGSNIRQLSQRVTRGFAWSPDSQ